MVISSASPVNNLVEVFNPISSTINSLINTPTKATTPMAASAATTTTEAPTTTTQVPTTPVPIPSTTGSAAAITMNPNAFGTTYDDLAFLNALVSYT